MTAENAPDNPPAAPNAADDGIADAMDLWIARCVRRYCDGAARVSEGDPLAVLVAGQPGAGKGAVVESLSRSMASRGFAVVLDPRELELLHPHYESLCLADERTASAEVAAEVAEAAEAVFLDAADARKNLIVETRLDDDDAAVADRIFSLSSCDYRVVLLLLCTTPEDSWAACEERYAREKADLGFGRHIDVDEHDRRFFALRDALLPLEEQGLLDEVHLITREGDLLFSTTSDDAPVGAVVDAYDDFLRRAWGEVDRDEGEEEGEAGGRDDGGDDGHTATPPDEAEVVPPPAPPEEAAIAPPPTAPATPVADRTSVTTSGGRKFKIVTKSAPRAEAPPTAPPPAPAADDPSTKPRGFKINIKKPAAAPATAPPPPPPPPAPPPPPPTAPPPRAPASVAPPPPPPSQTPAPSPPPRPAAQPVAPVSRRGEPIAPPAAATPPPPPRPEAAAQPTAPGPARPDVSQPDPTDRNVARRRLWQEKIRRRAGRPTDAPPQ